MKKAPQPGQSAQQAAIQTKPMGVSARAVTFAANSKIVLYMEIVSIEKKTFEEMVAQTDAFVEKVAALQRKGDAKRLGKWLTGEEVYRLFANRLPFLLQAGRCEKAHPAYRYDLPH